MRALLGEVDAAVRADLRKVAAKAAGSEHRLCRRPGEVIVGEIETRDRAVCVVRQHELWRHTVKGDTVGLRRHRRRPQGVACAVQDGQAEARGPRRHHEEVSCGVECDAIDEGGRGARDHGEVRTRSRRRVIPGDRAAARRAAVRRRVHDRARLRVDRNTERIAADTDHIDRHARGRVDASEPARCVRIDSPIRVVSHAAAGTARHDTRRIDRGVVHERRCRSREAVEWASREQALVRPHVTVRGERNAAEETVARAEQCLRIRWFKRCKGLPASGAWPSQDRGRRGSPPCTAHLRRGLDVETPRSERGNG